MMDQVDTYSRMASKLRVMSTGTIRSGRKRRLKTRMTFISSCQSEEASLENMSPPE